MPMSRCTCFSPPFTCFLVCCNIVYISSNCLAYLDRRAPRWIALPSDNGNVDVRRRLRDDGMGDGDVHVDGGRCDVDVGGDVVAAE